MAYLNVFRLKGQLESSRQAYLDTLELRPDNLDAAINLAHLHLEMREFSDTQRRFWQVYSLSGANLAVSLGMGEHVTTTSRRYCWILNGNISSANWAIATRRWEAGAAKLCQEQAA